MSNYIGDEIVPPYLGDVNRLTSLFLPIFPPNSKKLCLNVAEGVKRVDREVPS